MRKKTLHNAKLVVTVESNKYAEGPIKIKTLAVFDNRTQNGCPNCRTRIELWVSECRRHEDVPELESQW